MEFADQSARKPSKDNLGDEVQGLPYSRAGMKAASPERPSSFQDEENLNVPQPLDAKTNKHDPKNPESEDYESQRESTPLSTRASTIRSLPPILEQGAAEDAEDAEAGSSAVILGSLATSSDENSDIELFPTEKELSSPSVSKESPHSGKRLKTYSSLQ